MKKQVVAIIILVIIITSLAAGVTLTKTLPNKQIKQETCSFDPNKTLILDEDCHSQDKNIIENLKIKLKGG